MQGEMFSINTLAFLAKDICKMEVTIADEFRSNDIVRHLLTTHLSVLVSYDASQNHGILIFYNLKGVLKIEVKYQNNAVIHGSCLPFPFVSQFLYVFMFSISRLPYIFVIRTMSCKWWEGPLGSTKRFVFEKRIIVCLEKAYTVHYSVFFFGHLHFGV